MLAQRAGCQHHPSDRHHRVELTPPQGAVITVDLLLGGGPRHTRVFVVAVAHPWGGHLRVDRLPHRAGLGIEVPAQDAHPVGLLRAQGERAAGGGGFSVVGFGAVLIDVGQQLLGDLTQLLGREPGGLQRQARFAPFPSSDVDPARQFGEEVPDLGDVVGADRAAGHQGGHQRQHRFLGLPDQRYPWAQVAGVIHPPLGVGGGDLESVGQQRLPGLPAQRDGVGFAVQPGQDPVTERRTPAVGDLQLPQHSQEFGLAEPLQAHGGHGIGGSDVPGEYVPVAVLIHPSNISSTTDKTRAAQPSNPHLHSQIR